MGALATIVAGFASGIFIRSFVTVGWAGIAFALLVAGIFIASAFLRERRAYRLCAVFCIFCILGVARTALGDTPLPAEFRADVGHPVSYQGIVVGDPQLGDVSQRTPIRIERDGARAKILAVAPRIEQVAVSDRVTVTGVLDLPLPFSSEEEGGRTFRYDRFLAKDGIHFTLEDAHVTVDAPAPWYSLPAFLARMKHAFIRGLEVALPEPFASLAGGIVIGGKTGLGDDLLNAFIVSGLIQVIVLSGYNVMIVAECVMAALARFRSSRRDSAIAGALALLFFVGVAGFTSTAIRAMLMALIALYARATARTYAARRALLAAIFLMLVWNPLVLAFDPGFALSIAATAGLIWLAPGIEARLKIRSAFWKNAFATTLAAQLAVLPLLLYDTGRLSWVALPANLAVTALVPLAMAASAFAGIVGIISGAIAPTLAMLAGLPAYVLTRAIMTIARVASSLPGAGAVLPQFPFALVAVAYAALAFTASSKRFSSTAPFKLEKKAST